ncbi:hypothetical protein BT96DRAFT_1002063 [Gymnopus androsaceus JB14]|uniref:Uncharacterized protein n=1 Tax=Gymnopus androsaceus JB14 TaxID=1447944 RepID=A0A6A4GY49_9AGAR|nr:hypothetical protein BT96DRAFT_1002063 [Gymnopus androsaceus JB14]
MQRIEGLNPSGVMTTFTIPGNENKVEATKQKAKAWLDDDKKTKAIIARAVPLSKLYLIRNAPSAHDSWLALKREYKPANTLTAIHINQQIIGNACPAGGDPVSWLQSIVQLYNRLQDADPNMMPDEKFAKHLITLMSPDADWRYCHDNLRNRLKISEAARKSLSSAFVIQTLKDKEVHLMLHPSVAAINAIVATGKTRKGEDCAVAGVYTSSQDFIEASTMPLLPNRNHSRQPQRNDRKPNPNSSPTGRKVICNNTYCTYPVGHTKAKYFVYGGGRVGRYPVNFKESSRGTSGRDNRNRNQQGPCCFAGVAEFEPTEEEVHKMVGNLEEELVFLMEILDDLEGSNDNEIRIGEKVKVDVVALNLDIPQDDSVNHDTGATPPIVVQSTHYFR